MAIIGAISYKGLFIAYLFVFMCSKAKATLHTFGGLRYFWKIALSVTPDDLLLTSNPINGLYSGQWFFLPDLVAMGHS